MGRIHQEVANQANSYKDSVISLCTHGASGFEELFIGSNANKIIDLTERPVLTIRKGVVPDTIKRIVLPIDMIFETRQKIPITTAIAELFGAEIHVVTVSMTQDKSITERLETLALQVNNYMKSKNVKNVVQNLNGNNITDITIDYAKQVNADLISIITEQEFAFANIIKGSFAHQMVNKSEIPVLNITSRHITTVEESFYTFGSTGLEDRT